ncbi:MAG: hypothetical protein JWN72_505 [Thermoleophilia bacterium]|nr:hypothetical protein [Thermoleophilia bacterium]
MVAARIARAAGTARRAVRWGVGTPVELWRYATRGVEVHRTEIEDPDETFEVSRLPRRLAVGVQTMASGVGPAFHRRYSVRVIGARTTPAALLGSLERNFNAVMPGGMSEVDDTELRHAVGDELRIHLAGPWDAPVRVIDTDANRMRFATLDGHMEAGEIEFRIEEEGDPGELELVIESWARSSGPAFAALYHPLGLAKEVQLHMWATVLERLAHRSGGEIVDGIRVVTRRREPTRA